MEMSDRVAKLKRQCRHYRMILWTGALLAVGFIGMGLTQGPMEDLVLRRLVLVDAEGYPRMVMTGGLESEDSGGVILQFDSDGNLRVRLGIDADGSCSLSQYDQDENLRVASGVAKQGVGGLSCYDENGLVTAELGLLLDGQPHLVLTEGLIVGPSQILCMDGEGRTRIAIDAEDRERDAGIHLIDEELQRRLWLGTVGDDGPGEINLYSPRGDKRWSASTSGDDCFVQHLDRNGVDRIGSGTLGNGFAMQLLSDAYSNTRITMVTSDGDRAVMALDGLQLEETVSEELLATGSDEMPTEKPAAGE